MKRILIFGLPGAGKSALAAKLSEYLNADWYNADRVRAEYNDWDFTPEGRARQMSRMLNLARISVSAGKYAVCDFVCPTTELRNHFAADYMVWMNTIEAGRFEDTNKIFQTPVQEKVNVTINKDEWWTEERIEHWARVLTSLIKQDEFDARAPTVQMLGRYQPWHAGHQALFERALAKTGQVAILVRNMEPDDKNPWNACEVVTNLNKELYKYAGKFKPIIVPNIVNITYGRDVGYKIEQEVFDDSVHSISATKIREQMKLDGRL